jgi:hypothetical protein
MGVWVDEKGQVYRDEPFMHGPNARAIRPPFSQTTCLDSYYNSSIDSFNRV